jgi:hypothetical protein
MELKTARLTLLIDPNKKEAFERLCATQDRTASQVVRQLIRDYLAEHGVAYVARGSVAVEPARKTPSRSKPAAKRKAAPAKKASSARRKA